jgi:hypothetical protein
LKPFEAKPSLVSFDNDKLGLEWNYTRYPVASNYSLSECTTFSFLYAQGNDPFKEIQKADSKFLSSGVVGGFTGGYVGFYSTGNGKKSTANADFDWFEYVKYETPPATNTRTGF